MLSRAREFLPAVDAYSQALWRKESASVDLVETAEVGRRQLVNFLAARAIDYASALEIYDRVYDPPLAPDVYRSNILIARAETYTLALAHFTEMTGAGLVPDVYTYSSLIELSTSETAAAGHFRDLKHRGLKPDLMIYTSLIDIASNFGLAYTYFKEMVRAGVKPDQFLFQVLIRKAHKFDVARQIIDVMRNKFKFKPNKIAYAKAVSLAATETEAFNIVKMMILDMVLPDLRLKDLLHRRRFWGVLRWLDENS